MNINSIFTISRAVGDSVSIDSYVETLPTRYSHRIRGDNDYDVIHEQYVFHIDKDLDHLDKLLIQISFEHRNKAMVLIIDLSEYRKQEFSIENSIFPYTAVFRWGARCL